VAEAIREAMDFAGMSQSDLSAIWGVSAGLASALANGYRSITPLVALRLEAAGLGSAVAWMDLQRDAALAEHRVAMAVELTEIEARRRELGL